ncbi:MAG: chorismate mutase [Clostridia bacterium]|nr:chorismate mutase [Clostridia bacterium]
MKLEDLRNQIDAIDNQIAELYVQRMDVAREIGVVKEIDKINLQNTTREKEIISRVTAGMPEEIKLYGKQVFETLFSTSKAYQSRLLSINSDTKNQIENALKDGTPAFPIDATVACQGVPGAYSQIAADRMIEIPNTMFFKDWESVFNAVEKGLCKYGVLPIENSSVGSVNGVYDLISLHKCFIVRSAKIRIQHFFLAKKGTCLEDIKEIFSHEQAIGQCSKFLKQFANAKITIVNNTAIAAKSVMESDRNDVACVASHECAGIYGLNILEPNIQDNENNYTRFIAISKDLKIYDGANKISITCNLAHEPGSLNKMLNSFSTLGLNLTKLESRPVANSSFEFNFYFDFDADIKRPEVKNLIAELDNSCDRFTFLGAYQEI